MEVVVSTAEFQPGEFIPLHIHHGEEGFYVIQGATVETPEGKQIRASDRGWLHKSSPCPARWI